MTGSCSKNIRAWTSGSTFSLWAISRNMGKGFVWPGPPGQPRRVWGSSIFPSGGPIGPGIKLAGHIIAAVRQPELWINQQGHRFCDESIVHNSIFCGNAMARQKGSFVFRIFDDQARRYFVEKGIDVGVGMFVPPGTRLLGFDEELKEALAKENQNIFIAETIDDLAMKMGVPPTVFKKTVEDYNRFCEKGYDEDFVKDRFYLRPVQKPPFHAFKCYVDFCGTNGGIKVNEKTEVLDKEDEVIPGLYAAGNDAGGMYGDSYDMIAAGSACGFALVSGCLAGENALAYLRL